MERFNRINWHTPTENIVDNKFIENGSLERNSSAYKILSGNFIDPFKDLDEEYANVDKELIEHLVKDDPLDNNEINQETGNNYNKNTKKKNCIERLNQGTKNNHKEDTEEKQNHTKEK